MIEAIIVMGLFLIISTISVSILVSSFRAINKARTINELREEGNFAMNQMKKEIRNAKSFVGVSVDPFNYSCYKGGNRVQFTSPNGASTIFYCELVNDKISSNGTSYLINSSKINIESCSFDCTQSSVTGGYTIGIRFTLSAKTTSAFPEKNQSIPFRSSVLIRNK